VVVDEERSTEMQTLIGKDAIHHLHHHGIEARLRRVLDREHDIGLALIKEAERFGADVIVMGGYGHSRLREMLLGGVHSQAPASGAGSAHHCALGALGFVARRNGSGAARCGRFDSHQGE
jgi:hypothetical protein